LQLQYAYGKYLAFPRLVTNVCSLPPSANGLPQDHRGIYTSNGNQQPRGATLAIYLYLWLTLNYIYPSERLVMAATINRIAAQNEEKPEASSGNKRETHMRSGSN